MAIRQQKDISANSDFLKFFEIFLLKVLRENMRVKRN